MKKMQTILVGTLLLQLLLILLVRSPLSSASRGADQQPLVEGLDDLVAAKLEVLRGDDEKVTLIRGADGWSVEELASFPADSNKIDELLDKLRGLNVGRPIVSSSRYHASFNVEDDKNEGRVRIWSDSQNAPVIDLILGSSPSYRALHVRRADEDPVFAVSGLAAYDISADSAHWIEKRLIDVPQSALQSLVLRNDSGEFELARDESGWKIVAPAALAGQTLDDSKIESLLGVATSVRMAEPEGPLDEEAQQLFDPVARLTLRWNAGEGDQETVLLVGGKVGDKAQRYVTREGFGFTGAIWETSITALMEQKADELIE